jgi:hypothetical protein
LHVHFHTLCADGVYVVGEGDELGFIEAPPPTRGELEAMLVRIYARVMKWLNNRGFLRGDDDAQDERQLSINEALAQAAMQRGTLVTVASDADDVDDAEAARPPPSPTKTDAVVLERFNLHASVRIVADDNSGRERLGRYITRPPFALGRFRRLRDGTIAYRVKKVSRHRVTERVMTPVECLARLASIVAPPRYPLLRLHGIFGARHRWRARLVPKPPAVTKSSAPKTDASCDARVAPPATPSTDSEREAVPPTAAARGDGRAAFAPPALDLVALVTAGRAALVAPDVLSLLHWERIEHGALFATTSRIDWRSLLRRSFQVDLRTCQKCGARLEVRAVVTDPDDIERVLPSLHHSRDPPAAA